MKASFGLGLSLLLLGTAARATPFLDPPSSAQASLSSSQALPAPVPLVHPALAQAAGWVPGLLVHGTGVLLQGRHTTGKRLLMLEGISLLTTVGGFGLLAATGAADESVWAGAYLSALGVAGFGTSTLANLYATMAPRQGFGQPQRALPLLTARLGYARVEDPVFAFRNFTVVGLELAVERVRAAFSSWQAPGQDNQWAQATLGYRLVGPAGWGSRPSGDGSFLEPRIGYSLHRFSASGFSLQTMDWAVRGRLDSHHYLPDARGAFFELEAGYAQQWIDYDLPGVSEMDATSLLLMSMGFGVYLPAAGVTDSGGEVMLYYDHRHDGFAAGFKSPTVGSGAAGHFGVDLRYRLGASWGVDLSAQVGSAWVLSSALVYRVGVPALPDSQRARR